ncbi:hypothetical protein E3H11_04730 [Bradyrhizobium brasilense]|uniref:hypothetical protein n=1 Tax=Bradyrhizobium brasilense TaxID=1419277 RepID=UPI001456DBA4|nr:hypothetical protein [Bradyrhizobium brasilense]NLS68233.1 hypothetical protein [Bradyrhizobium brasilense]
MSQDDGWPYLSETLLNEIEPNGGRSHIERLRKRDPAVSGRSAILAALWRNAIRGWSEGQSRGL